MKDINSQVMDLKRPKILVRAARFGLDDYMRERHLKRCLKKENLPSPGQALIALLDIEKQLNSDRATKSGGYQVAKHIDVLVAIMAEAQLFRAAHRSVYQPISSGRAALRSAT
ncbi:MAG: DUF6477 family protein [Pseudomonadota bacterium]